MKIVYSILLSLLFIQCSKKNEESETLSSDPKIGFVSLDPQEVDNFNNSITLTISYSDNNGDLGSDDPDVFSLWVKDSRLDSADYYHVPPLAPLNEHIKINGQLEIVLNSLFILGNGNQEITSLSVKIKDRSNHWSNIINTPPITINK